MTYKLIIFDGDDTLWRTFTGKGVSDNGPTDREGDNGLRFAADDEFVIVRSDGSKLELYPETREVLAALKERGVLVALCTWNHPSPVDSALRAWRLREQFDMVQAQWNPDKAGMLQGIVDQLRVAPADALFIDDDPGRGHRQQAAQVGVDFRKKGLEINDLREVLELV